MTTITAPAPLSPVTVGDLSFDWGVLASRQEISVHTTSVDGLTLILSVKRGYGDDDSFYAKASHWLADNDSKCPNGLTPILSFFVAKGADPAELAARLAAIKFERVTYLRTNWIVSSIGHAGAVDQNGEVIEVHPQEDGTWWWKRECHAFHAFYDATGASLRLEGYGCPTREAAMGEALAVRENMRGAIAKLAMSFGINVVS